MKKLRLRVFNIHGCRGGKVLGKIRGVGGKMGVLWEVRRVCEGMSGERREARPHDEPGSV